MKRPKLRTWVLLGVLAVLLALAGVAYLVSVSQREGVNVAPFYDRLTLGMTEAEVGAAVSLPPGDHTNGHEHTTSAPICEGGLPLYIDYHPWPDGTVTAPHPVTGRPLRGKWWRGEDGLVIVFFGDDQRVIERRYYPGSSRSWVWYHWDRLVR
jgi:hypothetical protein